MKFICVGRNYAEHATELGNAVPDEPLLFLKPETARIIGNAFVMPSFSKNVHYECELVVSVKRPLTNVSVDQAHAALDTVSLGLDFTARDLQDELKKKGLPWEKAKSFDGSAYVSPYQKTYVQDENWLFTLKVNGETRQSGDSRLMLTNVAELVAYASRFFTVLPEDCIFTGTPAGVGSVKAGDVLEGFLGDEPYFRVTVEG